MYAHPEWLQEELSSEQEIRAFLKTLLEMPPQETVIAQALKHGGRSLITGELLLVLTMLQYDGGHGTLNKALFLTWPCSLALS